MCILYFYFLATFQILSPIQLNGVVFLTDLFKTFSSVLVNWLKPSNEGLRLTLSSIVVNHTDWRTVFSHLFNCSGLNLNATLHVLDRFYQSIILQYEYLLVNLVSFFNGISAFVGYLMQKLLLLENSCSNIRHIAGKRSKSIHTFPSVIIWKWT